MVTARTTSVKGFGLFALAFGAYLVFVGATRALIGVPLTLAPQTTRNNLEMRAALGASAAIGLCSSLLMLTLGLLAQANSSWYVVVAGLPFLLCQDTLRYAAIARLRPQTAAASDTLWLLVQVAFLAIPGGSLSNSIGAVGWVLGAAVSLSAFNRYWPGLPQPIAGVRVLLKAWNDRKFFLYEFLTNVGVQQVAFLLLTLFWGLPVVAALRGGQTILGPANVFTAGLYPVVTRQVANARSASARQTAVLLFVVSGVAVPLMAAGVSWVLPGDIGRSILGATWNSAAAAAIPLSLAACVYVLISTGVLFLTGSHEYRLAFTLRAGSALLFLLCLCTLGLVTGPRWAAWAWLLGYLLGSLLLIPIFRVAVARGRLAKLRSS